MARLSVALACVFAELPLATAAAADTKPVFRVRTVAGVDYRNVCGAPGQLPIIEQNGQGIGIIDYNNDGLVDLLVPNGSTESRWRSGKDPGCRLYKSLGKWQFRDVTEEAGVRGNAWTSGVAVADYDADGDFDVYVLNWGANVLYRNNGNGTFSDITKEAGVGEPRWCSSAAFADFNNDGLLDIFVSNYVHFDYDNYPKMEKDGRACLYKGVETGCGPWCYEGERSTLYMNAGDGRFEDRSVAAGLECTKGFRGLGVVAADFDNDGDADVYLGCDVMPNLYLENVGGGKFRSVGEERGGALNEVGMHESGMGVAAADFDRSGTLDLFTTNFADEKNTFYRNETGSLTDASRAVGFDQHRPDLGWGVLAEDFNQDGLIDVFVANGHIYPQVKDIPEGTDRYAQPPRLYLQSSSGTLDEVAPEQAFGESLSLSLRGAASADLDNDGDLDIVAVQHNGPLLFLENGSDRPALTLELLDARGGRSPMGARVSIAGMGTRWLLPNQGYQSSNDHRLHIAIPQGRRADHVTIQWPDGRSEDFAFPPDAKGVVRLRQKPR